MKIKVHCSRTRMAGGKLKTRVSEWHIDIPGCDDTVTTSDIAQAFNRRPEEVFKQGDRVHVTFEKSGSQR